MLGTVITTKKHACKVPILRENMSTLSITPIWGLERYMIAAMCLRPDGAKLLIPVLPQLHFSFRMPLLPSTGIPVTYRYKATMVVFNPNLGPL